MKTESKYIIYLTYFVLVGILFYLPFSIYGQDGYSLWAPVVSEYLKGGSHYTSSSVIFDGQNLAGIYGELPFWKIFRWLNFSFVRSLNLTHSFFLVMFTTIGFVIVSGFKTKSLSSFYLVLLFTLFSPVIVNRVMAGHLNLLFGIFPFFVFLSLIYCKSVWYCVFCIFVLSCSMSTQAFQILSYHVFYLPLLILLIFIDEKNFRKYLLTSIFILILACILSYPSVGQMIKHATSPDNLRGLNLNMTYSYIITAPSDLYQFVFSDIYPGLLKRNFGFYHEVSYPLGVFLLLFFNGSIDRKLKFCVGAMLLVFLFLSMNLPFFNLISEIPTIKPFRVPQRVFMILNLFIPLWVISKNQFNISRKESLLFICFLFASQLFSFMDFIIGAISAYFFINKRDRNIGHAAILGVIGLCAGSISKLSNSQLTHMQFNKISTIILRIKDAYSKEELNGRKFHFKTLNPVMINAVAQTHGLETLEGYGHPPKSLLLTYKKILNLEYSPLTNSIYIPPSFSDKIKLKEMGISSVVNFTSSGVVNIDDLEK